MKPKVDVEGQQELVKMEEQFQVQEKVIRSLDLDTLNRAPIKEVAPQHPNQKDGEIYIKPHRAIGSKEKFNDAYRKEYEFQKEYVLFQAQNNEIIGEDIDMWTKPFPGMPAEWWKVPVAKKVWAPRYVAEQIKRCKYHTLKMVDKATNSDGHGQYYGTMSAESTVQRLDALPVSTQKSIFLGA